jgi:hypothetical protein
MRLVMDTEPNGTVRLGIQVWKRSEPLPPSGD